MLAGLMAYTVRRRTVEEVKKMMAAAESPAEAVTRVSNTMHGRKAGDDIGDDDLLVSNTVISLKDPLSGTRIQSAARLPSHLHACSGFVATTFACCTVTCPAVQVTLSALLASRLFAASKFSA